MPQDSEAPVSREESSPDRDADFVGLDVRVVPISNFELNTSGIEPTKPSTFPSESK
jgi:hypothetical protein